MDPDERIAGQLRDLGASPVELGRYRELAATFAEWLPGGQPSVVSAVLLRVGRARLLDEAPLIPASSDELALDYLAFAAYRTRFDQLDSSRAIALHRTPAEPVALSAMRQAYDLVLGR